MNATRVRRAGRPPRRLTPEEDRAWRFLAGARAAERAAAMQEATLEFAHAPTEAEITGCRQARIYADTLTATLTPAGNPHTDGWAGRVGAAVLKLRTEAVFTLSHPRGGRAVDLVAVAGRVELATRAFAPDGMLF